MAVVRPGVERSEERAEVEGASEGGSGELGRPLWSSRPPSRVAGTRGVERESHGGASSAWLPRAPPLRSFPEHLVGDDVATLEPSFGHLRGIFGLGALSKVADL